MAVSLIGLIACVYVGYTTKNTYEVVAHTMQQELELQSKYRADMLAAAKEHGIWIYPGDLKGCEK